MRRVDDGQKSLLIAAAKAARENAYAKYSGFRVGAAVLTQDGRIYPGCNVENVSFGATVCAERAAICTAVGAGSTKLAAVCVAGSGDAWCYPCGICRQSLLEFAALKAGERDDMLVIICGPGGAAREHMLSELLPHAFEEFASE